MSSILTTIVVLSFAGAGPSAAADAAPPAAPFGYDKGVFLRSPDRDFSLKANGRVQARYTLDSSNDGDGYAVDDSAFSVPRARVKLGGNAFGPRLGFELQLDVSKGYFTLKDAFIESELTPWLSLRAGQQKRPFSLQQMTSSSKLALVDRAITDDYFGAGRDVGLELFGGTDADGLSWAFGLYNGSGAYKRFFGLFDAPADGAAGDEDMPLLRTPVATGRVAWSFRDVKMYDEADRDGGPLRAAVGASGYVRADPYRSDDGRAALALDAIVKAHGFSGLAALFASSAGGAVGLSPEAVGGHVQASYLVAERVLPVVQAAAVLPLDAAVAPLYEARAGVSVLFRGHDAKWTTDVGTVFAGAASRDYQLRTQLQLAF